MDPIDAVQIHPPTRALATPAGRKGSGLVNNASIAYCG